MTKHAQPANHAGFQRQWHISIQRHLARLIVRIGCAQLLASFVCLYNMPMHAMRPFYPHCITVSRAPTAAYAVNMRHGMQCHSMCLLGIQTQ